MGSDLIIEILYPRPGALNGVTNNRLFTSLIRAAH